MTALSSSPSTDRWLPLGRASQLLGVNASTLRQWADEGLVRAFRTPGGHRRFSGEDLEALRVQAAKGPAVGGPPPSLSDSALRRIRRSLHGNRATSFPWYAGLDEAARGRLRLFGRHLLDLTQAYLSHRRRRPEVMAEVRLMGEGYGGELARQKLPLRDALEAFIFFRHALLSTVKDPAHGVRWPGEDATQMRQHIEAMADELLLSMAQAFERSQDA